MPKFVTFAKTQKTTIY